MNEDDTQVDPNGVWSRIVTSLKRKTVFAALLCLWTPGVAFGVWTLLKYSGTPGRPAEVVNAYPAGASVRLASPRASLVLFVHPKCPCSRASIGELARIMAQAQGKVEATVYFYLPAGETSDWVRTDLWRDASIIPGAHAVEDRDGMTAQMFGAFTSGQTLLYNSGGRLLFSGGITMSRGHAGDNSGSEAIGALLQGDEPKTHHTPVFGCSFIREN